MLRGNRGKRQRQHSGVEDQRIHISLFDPFKMMFDPPVTGRAIIPTRHRFDFNDNHLLALPSQTQIFSIDDIAY
jgi:hypothetical protein